MKDTRVVSYHPYLKIAALVVVIFAAVACKSAEDGSFVGPWVGMLMGGSHPPPDDGGGTSLTVFYTGPNCTGEGFIAGGGEEFAYRSVECGGRCANESGEGWGP